MAGSFRRTAWTFPAAYLVHVAVEAPGFTAWARRNASERYTQTDFVRNNALGFVSTIAATVAITRSKERRALGLAYYSLVVTQQAVFNALFHVGTTLAYREYSPGVVTSVLTVPLWWRLTRAALTEHRLSQGDVIACTLVAGIVHAAVVARQVYLVAAPGEQHSDPDALTGHGRWPMRL